MNFMNVHKCSKNKVWNINMSKYKLNLNGNLLENKLKKENFIFIYNKNQGRARQ